ncbi:hypothetical protein BSKO_04077 [Bryopsis sp. KO-2023]|nr:hypothetical protein BSKO_04077 [Bryopsis sp. KO-2023]
MDVVLQTSNQPLAHRIVLYFNDKSLNVFPREGCGDEAVELGPFTNKVGPALALIRNVTLPQETFVEWLRGSFLFRYVDRLYWLDPDAPPVTTPEQVAAAVVREVTNGATLRDALPLDIQLEPRENSHVLSVVQVDMDRLRYSLTPQNLNYRQSTHKAGRLADSCSTAVYKLQEALHVVGISTTEIGTAIDLGAAPGAWTSYLAKQARQVISVDPAELSQDVTALSNVVHIKTKAEDAVEKIQQLAMDDSGADLVVCDMNQHPFQAVDTIKCILPVLKRGGWVVWTLKFFGVGRDRDAKLHSVQEKLMASVGGVKFVWLMANTLSERTLVGRKEGLD